MNVEDPLSKQVSEHTDTAVMSSCRLVRALILVHAQERDSATSANLELQRHPRSLQTAQLCFLLLKQSLSWARYLSTASPPFLPCDRLMCPAPPPHPWCSLYMGSKPSAWPCSPVPPQNPPACSVLPVLPGPNPMSCSRSWGSRQRMVVSVFIIRWARFWYSVKYILSSTCLVSEQSYWSHVQTKA